MKWSVTICFCVFLVHRGAFEAGDRAAGVYVKQSGVLHFESERDGASSTKVPVRIILVHELRS